MDANEFGEPSDMTGDMLRDWLHRHGFSIAIGADVLGVMPDDLQDYVSDREAVPLVLAPPRVGSQPPRAA